VLNASQLYLYLLADSCRPATLFSRLPTLPVKLLACGLAWAYTKPMVETLTLSRKRVADFTACRRRFQLRYIDRLPWPAAPAEEAVEEAIVLGQRFHQLAQRHYLGLPVESEEIADAELQRLWDRFAGQKPTLPPGRRFPELNMTIPVDRHFLTGRFDLLVLEEAQAHIYDWKTDAIARPASQLREDLQTRLYLALAAEGLAGLNRTVAPEQIELTYWYVNDPAASVTIQYSRAQHDGNWSHLQRLAAELDRQITDVGVWPLTDDLGHCAHCAYQVYCDRQTYSLDLSEWEPNDEALSPGEASSLEPHLP
jgi:hypothetical protein